MDTEYTRDLLLRTLLKNKKFEEAHNKFLDISGTRETYVLGGAVYRSILGEIRGVKPAIEIIEFASFSKKGLSENKSGLFVGFDIKQNPIQIRSIESLGFERLEEYFLNCPLNIDALAYDLTRGEIIGEKGIDGIKKGIIKVNNNYSLEEYCRNKGLSQIGYKIGIARKFGLEIEI